MLAVYPAGKMSSHDPLQFLRNLNALQHWTARLRELGYAPFPVADDYADIMRTTKDVTVEQIKEASLVWMRRADCVFVTPKWGASQGVKDEIAEADKLSIPVFFDLDALNEWRHTLEAVA